MPATRDSPAVASAAASRPVIVVPTYNEAENLETWLDRSLAALPQAHVLVVDDASPDRTGEIARRRGQADPRVVLLSRAGKQGLGRAYCAGLSHALAMPQAFTHLIQMDADLSHPADRLGALIDACERGADVAIGSRYVAGGGTRGWPLHRKLLSRAGGTYARVVLALPTMDPTAGFVCWRRPVLERIPLERVDASGYGFQIEMKLRAHRMGARFVDVPIVFTEREHGASKMTAAIAAEALGLVVRLRWAAARGQL